MEKSNNVQFKESPVQRKRHGLNDRIQHQKMHEKIPIDSKVMTILASMQIIWNMKNLMLL